MSPSQSMDMLQPMTEGEICKTLGLRSYPDRLFEFGTPRRQINAHMVYLAVNSGALITLSRKPSITLRDMAHHKLFNKRGNNIPQNHAREVLYQDVWKISDGDIKTLSDIPNIGAGTISSMQIATTVYCETNGYKLVRPERRPAEIVLKEALGRLNERTQNIFLRRVLSYGQDPFIAIGQAHGVSAQIAAVTYRKTRDTLKNQLGGYSLDEAVGALRHHCNEGLKQQ